MDVCMHVCMYVCMCKMSFKIAPLIRTSINLTEKIKRDKKGEAKKSESVYVAVSRLTLHIWLVAIIKVFVCTRSEQRLLQ